MQGNLKVYDIEFGITRSINVIGSIWQGELRLHNNNIGDK